MKYFEVIAKTRIGTYSEVVKARTREEALALGKVKIREILPACLGVKTEWLVQSY